MFGVLCPLSTNVLPSIMHTARAVATISVTPTITGRDGHGLDIAAMADTHRTQYGEWPTTSACRQLPQSLSVPMCLMSFTRYTC